MTWSKRMKHPSKMVNVGDQVETVVLSVNPAERRISLGMKQLAVEPMGAAPRKYPVGATVEGKVRNLTEFGAFVEIEDGIDGLVHVSNMSWTKRVKHPSEVMKKGDKIKAVISAIEPEHRRLSLGVKQLEPDAWETFFITTSATWCTAKCSARRVRFVRRDRCRSRRPVPQLRSGDDAGRR